MAGGRATSRALDHSRTTKHPGAGEDREACEYVDQLRYKGKALITVEKIENAWQGTLSKLHVIVSNFLLLVTGIYASLWSHGPTCNPNISQSRRTYRQPRYDFRVSSMSQAMSSDHKPCIYSFCALTLRNGGVKPAPTSKLEPGISFFTDDAPQPCLNGRSVRIYLVHETSALHDCKEQVFLRMVVPTSLICVSFFLRFVSLVLVMLRVNRRWRIVSRGLAKLLGSTSSTTPRPQISEVSASNFMGPEV
jgi:hypothetical protein